MRDIIKNALTLLKSIADMTPGTVDDKIVAAITAILGNDAILDVIVDLIDRWLNGPQPVSKGLLAVDVVGERLGEAEIAMLDEAGIDPGTILLIIQMVMQFIDWWRNRRG